MTPKTAMKAVEAIVKKAPLSEAQYQAAVKEEMQARREAGMPVPYPSPKKYRR